ncbi:MAG: dienelactone hydrolase family protein [Jatrophihabitantaceae bacterium]
MPDLSLGSPDGGSSHLLGYLARPAGSGPWPGVVAIHELFGLDNVLRRQCDRLAAAGYLTVGPDLFSDGGAKRCVVSTFKSLETGKGKPFVDIEASRRWLLDSADCSGKVGVIGFCMGGGFALVTSTRGFDAASANYGKVPRHAEQALAGACPIVGSYGKRDPLMLGQAAKLEKTLTALDVEHDVKVYPNAGHSFLNDEPNGPRPLRPLMRIAKVGPEPAAAADAWNRIEAFFAEHLQN